MAASLRGGLSLGLCGFSFWSHDIGGFSHPPSLELYRRWVPFGMLLSHSRCHGVPPREPWFYGQSFENEFRLSVELRYRLMPYLYAQSLDSCHQGHPLMRPLFFEYPNDLVSWLIEDEYLLGSNLLIAPLLEISLQRPVYLPPGEWIDYQSSVQYSGGQWHIIESGKIPCIILVKSGTVLPETSVVPSTQFIDWSHLNLNLYGSEHEFQGLIALPHRPHLHPIQIQWHQNQWKIQKGHLSNVIYHIQKVAP
jgi:alpha-D-xyloside xylohydrolase